VKSRILLVCVLACSSRVYAKEDIEFVAEHLPEVAMDNRYATLPVWTTLESQPDDGWTLAAQGSLSRASAGNLEISGPMLSVAASRALAKRWTFTTFGFADAQSLSGGDERALQTLFAPATPIERPVAARFEGLDGRANHYGAGFAFSTASDNGWLGPHRWVGGLLVEEIQLRDYGWSFTILAGPAAGTRGRIDFDNDYRHLTPFAGLQIVRERGAWIFSPHALLAVPLPRRGWVGHIATAQFDLHGDTAEVGNGKHFGDPSVTLGLDITYRPMHLSFDVGTAVSQSLLEPVIHKGIDRNWVLSVRWQH
jgi:hypothetical protein